MGYCGYGGYKTDKRARGGINNKSGGSIFMIDSRQKSNKRIIKKGCDGTIASKTMLQCMLTH